MHITLSQPYSFCQIGRRDNQEDARYPDSDCPQDYEPFFIVCDGVGGGEDGELASRTVCHSLGRSFSKLNWRDREFTTDDFNVALDEAYQALTRADEGRHTDMATTLTFVCFHQGGCTMAHLGDSRIYQIRPGRGIMYRSDDHSLVNELVHAGIISPEAAATHPDRSVITRCMAANDDERSLPVLIRTTDIEAGDYFFLCSDGVLAKVSEEQLEDIICSQDNDEDKCRQIAAMSRDSHDNNTAYLIRVKQVEGAQPVDDHFYEQSDDEHVTIRTQRTYPMTVDVDPTELDNSWGGRLSRFIKKVFK
ncbi:MAG: serine/threonine-protein phosphatase [Prevotella sp.]|nr:serine/threonine-protein phosphatase [Prevotella sp.]